MPEATAEARLFGWHHTGDVGRRDADGYVYIVDRKKDMIVTGGFNVFSAEVEAAVMELAGVRECAVVGVPDDKWGEAVTAIVALNAGAAVSRSRDHRPLQGAPGRREGPQGRAPLGRGPPHPRRQVRQEGHPRQVLDGAERNVH
ncbi:MAG: hypothetical protein WDM92_05935 [Caulobacteraceae bacterium]